MVMVKNNTQTHTQGVLARKASVCEVTAKGISYVKNLTHDIIYKMPCFEKKVWQESSLVS